MTGLLGQGDDDLPENAEINVTPFIDIMLVLLIIFMVAAPLSTVAIDVDLPGVSAAPTAPPEAPIRLILSADQSLTLGDQPVSRAALGAELDRLTGGDRDARIYLNADTAVGYGSFVEVMNILRSAGYLKVALVGLEAATTPAVAAP